VSLAETPAHHRGDVARLKRSIADYEVARASAEDVRDVPPQIDIPTLLVYGDRDVRAPLEVA
jgi:pimeloyl-ACP methyl ester carboxylesterase